MRKIIDIDTNLLPKLKLLAAIENTSVKKLMENAVAHYVEAKQQERMQGMGTNQKEDLGLLLLMQRASSTDALPAEVLFNTYKK